MDYEQVSKSIAKLLPVIRLLDVSISVEDGIDPYIALPQTMTLPAIAKGTITMVDSVYVLYIVWYSGSKSSIPYTSIESLVDGVLEYCIEGTTINV